MDAEALFDEFAAELVPRGASTGAMFGARSLVFGGKVFATTKNGRITVKLKAGAADHKSALEVGKPFDPSGKGRPMKDWVTFDAALQDDVVAGFVEAAFERAQGAA
jgi:TfoX/Sxy family transcriptional regulator of competence genes